MGRPKKSPPVHVEPEEESQDIPDEEPAAVIEDEEEDEPSGGGKAGISKADAVREALAQGKDGPEEGTDYIRSQYGIEMTRQMFSSYKAQEKARQAKKAGDGKAAPAAASPTPRQPRQAVAPITQREFTATPSTASLGGIIEDIDDIKRMLATHGEDGLKKLIDHLK